MNRENLIKLRDLMTEVANNGGVLEVGPEEVSLEMFTWGVRGACGTEACALGHAALSGRFPELRPSWGGAGEGEDCASQSLDFLVNGEGPFNGMQAAEAVFGLGESRNAVLFGARNMRDGGGPAAAAEVAFRIEHLLKTDLLPCGPGFVMDVNGSIFGTEGARG